MTARSQRPYLAPMMALALGLLPTGMAQAQDTAMERPEGVSQAEWDAIMATMAPEEEKAEPPAALSIPMPNPAGGGQRLSGPDMALILDFVLARFSEDENLQTGAHDPTQTGFNLQQVEMSLGASVDPFFRMDANLVFSQFGVEVEEAYATSTTLPKNLQVRMGQFLTRMGRINASHPHSWHFVDQPIVNGLFFGPEGSRGLGAEVSWLTPLPWYAEVVLSSNQAVGSCCAPSFYGANDLGVNGPQDLLYTGALKQFFALNDNLGLNWGLSAQVGPNSSGNGNLSAIYGSDVYLRFRPINDPKRRHLSFQAEGFMRQRQGVESLNTDYGAYAQLVAGLNIRWETGIRSEFLSNIENDPLGGDALGSRTRQTAQLTFYPSHFSRLRLQGSRDDASQLDAPIWATFLAFEALIGAHGSHAY